MKCNHMCYTGVTGTCHEAALINSAVCEIGSDDLSVDENKSSS
jgi:hypothetical protein